ncbi:MAG TPA: phage tail tape measure protein [Lachnoclostridium sp.]|uniref:phage tail tape measure protein n=1 Tax=Lacrimispora sp. TaxID=2719234 RepID=UPI000ECED27D|nr:phage tail tape measure protein [Lacrimispora sp.]HCD43982.1 phage tail tape measure protein [Lachnoclostridium sp.]
MGWKTEDMLKGLPGVMNLAAAFGEDLGSVSGIVTDTMVSFGMQAGESAQLVDILAQAAVSSKTSLDMMGKTFQGAAPAAAAFGYSMEDVAVAAGLMANVGIQGEEAGRSMNTILTNLSEPTKSMERYIQKLSVSLKDSTGEIKPLGDLLEELRFGFSGLTEAQKEEYAAEIAGKDGMAGLLAIMNGSDEEFLRLKEAMDHSTGAAERLSGIRMDNLAGDISLFKGAYKGIGLEVYSGISEELRSIVQEATKWISGFADSLKEGIPTAVRLMKQFADGMKQSFGPVIDIGKWFLSHPEVIKGGITGIVTAFAAFKLVGAAKAGISLLGGLSTLVAAWPVVAFGVAAGAIVGIAAAVRENNRNLMKEDLSKRFGTISLSMSELEKTARMILDNGNLNSLSLAFSELEKIKDLAGDFNEASEGLDKLNWKIGIGIALDDSDKEAYSSALDQMIKGAINIVEQAQYSANINVQALFGSNSETGKQLVDGFNSMYASINSEVADLGKRLGEAYETAMTDEIIDSNEAEIIQGLQQKLSDITDQVVRAKTEGKIQRIKMQYSGKELDSDTFKNMQVEIKEQLNAEREELMQVTDWNLGDLELQFQRGEITTSQYNVKKQEIEDQSHKQEMDYQARGLSFSTSSIVEAYQDKISKAIPGVKEGLDSAMEYIGQSDNSALAFDTDVLWKQMGFNKMDKTSRESITELWKGMESDYAELQSMVQGFLEKGEEIPQSIAKQLSDASFIGAVAGDQNAIWQMMAINAGADPEYRKAIEQMREKGAEIPAEIALYLDQNGPAVGDAIERLYNIAETTANDKFSNMAIEGQVKVKLNLPPMSEADENKLKLQLGTYVYNSPFDVITGKKPDNNAKGGLIRQPTLSWFAEEGPEMAIPINNSKRTRTLWQETGRLIGAYEENNYGRMYETMVSSNSPVLNEGNSSFAPVFSPTIYINGNRASQEETSGAVRMTYEQFKDWAMQFQHERFRVAF